jgi:DNA-binding response OmpR family regulator
MNMKKKVCIIDDERDFTELLGALLGFNGFVVETINDPGAGLERIKEIAFDVIVVDMMMPGLDGIGVIKGLRGSKNHASTTIFVLTCKILSDDERAFLMSQEVHLIAKPFDPLKFMTIIRKTLS